MLNLLFPRLTAGPARGAELFDWVTRRARQEHWYLAGGVPDTIDGRFAMVTTIVALVMVRLEHDADSGNQLAAALTERFVEVMEVEHREMGLGDPTLGKTVRKLVGSLARRVDLWRSAVGRDDWETPALASVYGNAEISPVAAAHTAAALRELLRGLESAPPDAIAKGKVE